MLHSKGKILPQIKLNEVELTEQFAIALRKEMHDQYWTCKMVAQAVGVSERTVKSWIMATRFPSGIQLVKLLRLCPYMYDEILIYINRL